MKRFAWMFALALITSGLLLWALRAKLGGLLSEPLLATLALLVVAVGLGAGAMAQRLVLGIVWAGLGAWLGLCLGVRLADLMGTSKSDEFVRAALVWMAAGCATTLSLCVGTLALARTKWAAFVGVACIPPVLVVCMYVGTRVDRLAAAVTVPGALMALEAVGLVAAAVWRRSLGAPDEGSD